MNQNPSPSIILLLLAILASPLVMSGETNLRVLAPYGLNETLYLQDEDQWTELRADDKRRGPVYMVTPAASVTLARMVGSSAVEGAEPEYEELVRCAMPEGASDVLLVLIPKAGSGYHTIVLNDSADAFGAGGLRFLNLSKDRMAVRINDLQEEISYLGQLELSFTESGAQQLVIMMATEVNDQYQLAFSQRRMIRSNLRYLLIAVVDQHEEIKVIWLRDFPTVRKDL